MKLTVGATLQNGKYKIQEVVPGRLSVTCRAIHTYLDQAVVLQTFSEAVQQNNNFGQFQEQFLAKVRELVKQPNIGKVSVLDYFKEGELPFVVLKSASEQSQQDSLPQLEDWFSIPLDPLVEPASQQILQDGLRVETASATATTVQPSQRLPIAESNGLRSPSHEPTRNVTVTVGGKRSSHAQTKPQTKPQSKPQSQSQNKGQTKAPAKAQAKAETLGKPTSRLPIALMVIALVGGATGAGMGLAFRLSNAQPGQSSTPRLSFFNREQSFAPDGDWPIQEDELYPSEPAIEQPLYRTNPSVEYSPLPQPLPSETTGWTDPYPAYEVPVDPEPIVPVAPVEVPEVKTNPKLPEEVLPNPEAPVITESEPAIDPLPPAELVPEITPQPVLPPIDAAPPESKTKQPLPDNSLNIVSQ